jgi:putative peptidoglycan lipid II flippase
MGRLALFTFPAAGLIALFARPIVALVYQRGAFNAQAVNVTAGPFAMYALGLGFHMLSGLLVRTFQAGGLSRYPILVAAVDIFVTGGLDFWVVSHGWGATGIAATNTLVAAARVAILSIFLYLVIRRSGWSLHEDVSVFES